MAYIGGIIARLDRGRRWPLLAIVALTAMTIAGCHSITEGKVALAPQPESNVYDYQLPPAWTPISSAELANVNSAVEGSGSRISAGAKGGHGASGIATNINVEEKSVGSSVTLEDYQRVSLQNLPISMPGASIDRPAERAELGGDPAFTIQYSNNTKGIGITFAEVCALHNGVAYTVTFTAETDKFADERPQFDTVVNSWYWND